MTTRRDTAPAQNLSEDQRAGPASGFSLLECLGALLIVGFATLMATAFLNTMSSTATRLRTQEELIRHLEATVESARAGAVPLQSGPVTPCPGIACVTLDDLRLSLDVEQQDLPGLWRVTVYARCSLAEQPLHRQVTTLVWRP